MKPSDRQPRGVLLVGSQTPQPALLDDAGLDAALVLDKRDDEGPGFDGGRLKQDLNPAHSQPYGGDPEPQRPAGVGPLDEADHIPVDKGGDVVLELMELMLETTHSRG